MRPLKELDLGVLRFLRTKGHQAPLERAMVALGWAGEWGAIWSATALVAGAADPSRRGRWATVAILPAASIIANYPVKRVMRRKRPVIKGLPALGHAAASSLSFPSAHATSSVAAATAIGRVAPGSRPLVYSLAALVCIGRPYLGMHYPSDVLVGAVLGFTIGKLVPGLDEPAELPRPSPAP